MVDMDTRTLEMMRIPFATLLFLGSVYALYVYAVPMDPSNVLGNVLGLVCIGVLVYSMVLFS
ncbi:MAG TPA: hypothetical protein VMC84_03580, partial [Methanocella sp.]|uniref:hypothetical protein n=1 Tax=Methanocella sp. TaxID=2052833 RepID=UPI002BD56EFE